MEELQAEQQDLAAEEATRARRHVLLAQKDELLVDYHRGALTAEAYARLVAGIDAGLADLERGPARRPGQVAEGDPTQPEAGEAPADQAES